MNQIRTFVSFSSKDHFFIRHLLSRLSDQELNPWDYSAEGQEIPAGGEIRRSLREKIAEADLFLPIISSDSCNSSVCGEEVRYALSQCERLAIVPLVDSPWLKVGSSWPGAYAELKNLRYCRIDLQEPLSVETALIEICQVTNTQYHPVVDEVVNFPFMSRLYGELEGKAPNKNGREGRENSIYKQLMSKQANFVKAMNSGHYDVALQCVERIISTCEDEFPDKRFYFPYIAKAVCQISCGQLDNAEATLNDLRPKSSDLPELIDENFFGAWGYIHSRKGQYREAMEAYQEALRRDPQDIAALYGEALNALFSGEILNLEALSAKIDTFRFNAAYSSQKFKALKGLLLLKSDRVEEAEQVFSDIGDGSDAMTGVVVHWADALVQQEKKIEALEMLTSFWDRLWKDASYLEQVARVALFAEDFELYMQVLDRLAERYPENRKHIVKKAAVFWRRGEKGEARALAQQSKGFGAPRTSEDSYYNGLACWILGQYERAEGDFEYSKKSNEHHYSRWIPKES